MVRIEGQIVIDRPVEEVFDFVADETNEPRYNPRMGRADKITKGPIGVGTRFRAESNSMRRAVPMVIEFTGYDRPRRLASTTHLSSMDLQGTLTFDPIPEGTRMQWSWDVEPKGVLKVMTPLVALMGRRQEQRIWHRPDQRCASSAATDRPPLGNSVSSSNVTATRARLCDAFT